MSDIWNPGVGARVVEKAASSKQVGSGKAPLVKSTIDEDIKRMVESKENYTGSEINPYLSTKKRRGRRSRRSKRKKQIGKGHGTTGLRTLKGQFKKKRRRKRGNKKKTH